MTRAEIEAIAAGGDLEVIRVEDVLDLDVRRWRAEFRRPAPASSSTGARATG